jgi:hypothetical protein
MKDLRVVGEVEVRPARSSRTWFSQNVERAEAGSPGRRSKASKYPRALCGNPQQIMEDLGCV